MLSLMRKFLLGVCLLWSVCAPLVAQNFRDIRWSGDYVQQSLPTILEEIQAQRPVQFFFRAEWLEGVIFSGSFDNASLDQVLEQLLARTELTYQPYQDFYVVLLQKNISALRASLQGDEPEKSLLIIGDSLSNPGQSTATVSGYVRDGATGQGITGATVLVSDLG